MIANFRNRLRGSAYWRDIIWQASGNGLAQAIGVLGMPLLTRLYTPHDFALQNLFLQVVGLTTGLMTLRYEYFIQLPKEDIDSKYLLHLVFLLGFIVWVILTPIIWFYKITLANWLGDTTLAPWLVFAPITSLLICYALVLQHNIQRQKNYRKSGVSELVGKSLYIICGIVGSWYLTGSSGLIAASAASAIGKIACLFNLGKSVRTLPESFENIKGKKTSSLSLFGMWRLARIYAHLSGSMVFTHLMATCTAAIPSVFIFRAYGGEVLGQFTLVISTVWLPSSLMGSAIGQVYYQRAAEYWANGKSFADIRRSTARRLVLMGLPLYTGVAIISPWIYPLIFGQAWTDSGHYASVMVVSAFFSFVSTPLDRTCLIVGAWWYMPFLHTVRAVTTLFIALLSWLNNWKFDDFLMLYAGQLILIYLVDYWAGWRFSLRKPQA